jgi:hypothetical protein
MFAVFRPRVRPVSPIVQAGGSPAVEREEEGEVEKQESDGEHPSLPESSECDPSGFEDSSSEYGARRWPQRRQPCRKKKPEVVGGSKDEESPCGESVGKRKRSAEDEDEEENEEGRPRKRSRT